VPERHQALDDLGRPLESIPLADRVDGVLVVVATRSLAPMSYPDRNLPRFPLLMPSRPKTYVT
jgi:hypothetical protein